MHCVKCVKILTVLSLIRAKPTILSLYGKTRVSQYPYSRIFYAVTMINDITPFKANVLIMQKLVQTQKPVFLTKASHQGYSIKEVFLKTSRNSCARSTFESLTNILISPAVIHSKIAQRSYQFFTTRQNEFECETIHSTFFFSWDLVLSMR